MREKSARAKVVRWTRCKRARTPAATTTPTAKARADRDVEEDAPQQRDDGAREQAGEHGQDPGDGEQELPAADAPRSGGLLPRLRPVEVRREHGPGVGVELAAELDPAVVADVFHGELRDPVEGTRPRKASAGSRTRAKTSKVVHPAASVGLRRYLRGPGQDGAPPGGQAADHGPRCGRRAWLTQPATGRLHVASEPILGSTQRNPRRSRRRAARRRRARPRAARHHVRLHRAARRRLLLRRSRMPQPGWLTSADRRDPRLRR